MKFTFICIISFLGEIQAQEKDTIFNQPIISLSTVFISDSVNTPKFLWNLLKYNYNKPLKDTSLYYSIDFSTYVPDSNWHENFKGVILKEIRKGKQYIYLCQGEYKEFNYLNNFKPVSLDLDWSKLNKLKKYKKFKKNKIFKLKSEIDYNSFFIYDEEKKDSIYFLFKNKELIQHRSVIQLKKRVFGIKISEIGFDLTYKNFNKTKISTKSVFYINYSVKNVIVNAVIKYNLIDTQVCSNKIRIKNSVTPKFLEFLLDRANKKKKDS